MGKKQFDSEKGEIIGKMEKHNRKGVLREELERNRWRKVN